jgi:hypothetical protein
MATNIQILDLISFSGHSTTREGFSDRTDNIRKDILNVGFSNPPFRN